MAIKIILDAGHGGYDAGASYYGRKEKEDVLKLTLAVGKILENAGYDVEYTRTTDVYNTPFEKAQIGNASGADYFVSIHRNSSERANQYSGAETLIYDNSGIKSVMAENINEELEKVGFNNLGIDERPGLVVLRRTQMPSVLVEAGFINSDKDNQLFDERFDDVAQAIATGIEKTIGTQNMTDTEQVQPENYQVQVGLFARYENAEYLLQGLIEDGFEAEIEYQDPFYAVLVGNEPNLEKAAELQRRLKELDYDTLIVEY